jgi:hypothetical protein
MGGRVAEDPIEHLLLDPVEGGPGSRAWPRQVDLGLEIDHAVLQNHDSIGQHDRLVHVVRDEQSSEPLLLPESLDQPLHTDPRQRVERSQRLVEQE